jgi:hypothetical protein
MRSACAAMGRRPRRHKQGTAAAAAAQTDENQDDRIVDKRFNQGKHDLKENQFFFSF